MKSPTLSLIALLMAGCFVLCLFAAQPAEAIVFHRCKLAKLLLEKYKFNKTLLSNWICLVQYESNFDTSKMMKRSGNPPKYGLFQINGRDYCTPGRPGGKCKKKCEDFIDDNIDDDVECAKMVFHNEGFKYWPGWVNHCRSMNNLPNLRLLCHI